MEACEKAAGDPAIASRSELVAERYRALQEAQQQVDRLYARWAELEEKRGGSGA